MLGLISGIFGVSDLAAKAIAIGTVVAMSLAIFAAVFGYGFHYANLKGEIYDAINGTNAAQSQRCTYDDSCRGVRDPNAADK